MLGVGLPNPLMAAIGLWGGFLGSGFRVWGLGFGI